MKSKTKLKVMYSLFVAFVMAIACFSFANVYSVSAQTEGSSINLEGDGSETTPYLISSLEELEFFRDDVNGGNTYQDKYIKLTSDIDLSSVESWTPIGNNVNQFKGYFDGNKKTILNLKILGNNKYSGFFGYIKGKGMTQTSVPSVKNLTLSNVSVSGDYYVGGLSGQGYTCNITNVSVSGEVSGVRYVGGLIGHVYTYFKDCNFNGNATCSFDALGGIAGAGDCRAYDCSVIGTISGSNWVGGIVGNGQEGTSAVGCYVKATVSTSSNWYFGVGGIAGVGGHGYETSKFENNYFDGEVYLEGQKVNAIVTGLINADNNESIKTTVAGNSWNTEYYDVDTSVLVVAEVESNATPEEWALGAAENLTTTRNNNLVVLESDIKYVDATDINDVVIMDVSKFDATLISVQPEDLTQQIAENRIVVFIDANKNGTCDEGEEKYETLTEALNTAKVDDVMVLVKNTDESVKIPAGIKLVDNGYSAPNVVVEALLIEDVLVERNAENTATIITIIYSNSEKITTFTIYDGKNGVDGIDGKDGINGVDGIDGINGVDGIDGKDGINGVDGKDGGVGLATTALIFSGIVLFLNLMLFITLFCAGARGKQ